MVARVSTVAFQGIETLDVDGQGLVIACRGNIQLP